VNSMGGVGYKSLMRPRSQGLGSGSMIAAVIKKLKGIYCDPEAKIVREFKYG
jgi:hypothetical protein